MRTNKVNVAQKHSQSLRHAFTRSARVMRRARVRQSRAKSIGKQNTLMVSHVTVGRRQPNLSYFNLDDDPSCCFLVTLLDGYHQYVLHFRLSRPGCRHWLHSLYSDISTHLAEGGGEHCISSWTRSDSTVYSLLKLPSDIRPTIVEAVTQPCPSPTMSEDG